ncbi:MAG: ChbG/HpnK family deacetylase [Lachnospiraceae bacterium]|nr:ChbG/HpnK family deacetylase [Lachnospiraceae bacterium]
MNVIMHADDYGYNLEVSRDILDCAKNGTLHGISIMPNSPYFDECMKELSESGLDLIKTIHFSISEGPCLSKKEDVKLLVNDDGMFCLSFFKLLLMSIGANKKELERELYAELKAQYEKALPYLDEINMDSHVHYHMIPLVLRTVIRVVEDSGKQIGYLRVPAEPIKPFINHKEFISSYSLINFIKNIVLNVLALRSKKLLKKYRNNTAVFFGILMSGHMDIKRVSAMVKDFEGIAEKRGLDLEVLAHPGKAVSLETVLDPGNEEYAKAPLSSDRHIEKEMFMEISKYL